MRRAPESLKVVSHATIEIPPSGVIAGIDRVHVVVVGYVRRILIEQVVNAQGEIPAFVVIGGLNVVVLSIPV